MWISSGKVLWLPTFDEEVPRWNYQYLYSLGNFTEAEVPLVCRGD